MKERMMAATEPVVKLGARFSSPDAPPRPWAEARGRLEHAEIFWLSTVRPDGRPHVTPLIAVWLDEALWFCTGADERKGKNIARNPRCILTAGCDTLAGGLDVVVEGEAVQVRDEVQLRRVADAYSAKYGSDWKFTVRDGAFHHHDVTAMVFKVAPSTAFSFEKGERFSQTRYRF
jgi:nitroimidazol reductase NimA-like FMN-containing flavoprotein (pyridoxamine 5'-phosphate oxidase superfamily)